MMRISYLGGRNTFLTAKARQGKKKIRVASYKKRRVGVSKMTTRIVAAIAWNVLLLLLTSPASAVYYISSSSFFFASLIITYHALNNESNITNWFTAIVTQNYHTDSSAAPAAAPVLLSATVG
jgi:hypothetical protein